MQAVAESVHVEKREREKEPVGAGDLPARVEIYTVRSEVVMGEDGAFEAPVVPDV